jgi:hypothetical protein
MEFNFETNSGQELGVGFFARADKFALRGQYRFFWGRDNMNGLFAGLFLQAEWRKMYWFYNEDNLLTIGWSYPFNGDNVFHSIGGTAGLDIGFRLRFEDVGITPYLGFGYPLYILFGDMPPAKDTEDFRLQNIIFRGLDIGLRIDFFL